ncbi:hypothetical protein P4679_24665 [Priestia megaterium]|uniref:hypothetical protein n=1 Tax=Priestia megaterium TaxID=1404 RepID=UPI002E239393|nr:hypothetical protein [Priestia megaterium]
MASYLVALRVDERNISYSNYQIIEADNKEAARHTYNEINECSYFYGEVLAKVNDVNEVQTYLDKLSNSMVLLQLAFRGSLIKSES